MKQKKWPVRLISGGLMTLALVGVAVAAGQQGSKNDPLVTLSYLNDQALPAILEQVDDKVADKQTELEKRLDAVVDSYVQEVESKLNGSSGSSSGGVFQIVNLKAGQTVVGTAAFRHSGVRIRLRPRSHRYHGGLHPVRRKCPDCQPPVSGHHRRPGGEGLHRCDHYGAGELYHSII